MLREVRWWSNNEAELLASSRDTTLDHLIRQSLDFLKVEIDQLAWRWDLLCQELDCERSEDEEGVVVVTLSEICVAPDWLVCSLAVGDHPLEASWHEGMNDLLTIDFDRICRHVLLHIGKGDGRMQNIVRVVAVDLVQKDLLALLATELEDFRKHLGKDSLQVA